MNEKLKVGPGVIGDLLLGEVPFWQAGVCKVEDNEDEIVVRGENDHPVGTVELDEWTESPLDGEDVLDLEVLAEEVNDIIEQEQDEL